VSTNVDILPHATKIETQFSEWSARMHQREERMAGHGKRSTVDLSEELADEQPELGWELNLE